MVLQVQQCRERRQKIEQGSARIHGIGLTRRSAPVSIRAGQVMPGVPFAVFTRDLQQVGRHSYRRGSRAYFETH